jgi:RNA polymerase sigma-70 factor, ECF subfamily
LTDVPVTFADMMRQHWKGVWSFVYTIVRRSEVADDLTQETFIRAYQHWGEYRGESSLKTWLFTIAKHAATDHLRSAAVRRLIPFSNANRVARASEKRHKPSAESEFFDGLHVNEIWSAILSLGQVDREVITLRVREELSFRELAKVLNISEGNARVQYHRAIQKLKDKLQAEVLSGEL